MNKQSSIFVDITLIALVITAYVFLAGCASTGAEHFSEIKDGMDKDQVLQTIGNPFRTEKGAVKEKWAYRYFTGPDKDVEVLKYVEFMNGRVTASGDDEEEMRRLRQLKEKELKRRALEVKKEKVDDVLEKEYSH